MVKSAYLLLGVSLIFFLGYFVSKKLNFVYYSDSLFWLSAITLIISLLLFRKINLDYKIDYSTKPNGNYDKILSIKIDDLIIRKNNDFEKEKQDDYDDVNFFRIDTIIKHKENKISNTCYIYYKYGDVNYISRPIFFDIKALQLKLFLKKEINLYIDIKNKSYFFDLTFLNN